MEEIIYNCSHKRHDTTMKKIPYFLMTASLTAGLLATSSCSDFFAGAPGELLINIHTPKTSSYLASKSTDTPPGAEDFLLSVKDAEGKIYYEGRFGDSPESLALPKGTYTVSAFSERFEAPEYSKPQYGDTQIVTLSSEESVAADLYCHQINSGLRLAIDDSFIDCFPSAMLYLTSSEGELIWNYDETRTAFFSPGEVVVSMNEEGKSQKLFSRTLEEQQILSIKLHASDREGAGEGITLQVDSSRTWIEDSFVYGEDNADEIWGAYNINEARQKTGKENVWVHGYIVGVATSSGKIDFEEPFDKDTNIILGLRSNTSDKEYCLSVELKSGDFRKGLNLVDNPQLKGRHVYIKGDLVSAYYGIPGLKDLEEYQLGD